MTLYFIKHRINNGLQPLTDYQDYFDLSTVREECIVTAKQIVSDWISSGAPFSGVINQAFEVTDDNGNTVLILSFADALEADTRGKLKTVLWPD